MPLSDQLLVVVLFPRPLEALVDPSQALQPCSRMLEGTEHPVAGRQQSRQAFVLIGKCLKHLCDFFRFS
ncbi:MAG: hypothetical protein CMN92_03730 [Synechococcus sp. CPC100]|nr:hypothetical protein [Synechococcus sp. CPC100]